MSKPTFIDTVNYVLNYYDIEAAGSFYDRLTPTLWCGNITTNSAVLIVSLRRRQGHAHPKPWDRKVVIATTVADNETKYEFIGVPE